MLIFLHLFLIFYIFCIVLKIRNFVSVISFKTNFFNYIFKKFTHILSLLLFKLYKKYFNSFKINYSKKDNYKKIKKEEFLWGTPAAYNPKLDSLAI